MKVHKILALALAPLLAGCVADTDASTTTTSPEPTSSTVLVTTTSTSAPTTTTSTAATTTTEPISSTLTTPPLEGNWGDQPLVTYDDWGGIALGWWDGMEWIQVEEETALPVTGGEDYQVALLDSSAVIAGGPPTNAGCDVVFPEGLPGVPFEDGSVLQTSLDDGEVGDRRISGVAITAAWQLHPRAVADGEANPEMEDVAIDLLMERGFVTDSVEVVQITEADLDGDGTIETLLVAEATELANEMSDVYSILFATSPSWDAAEVIAGSVIPAGDTGFPASFRVSSIADLSGDGVMEVVVDGLAWENGWVTVYELSGSSFETRIEAGCGV